MISAHILSLHIGVRFEAIVPGNPEFVAEYRNKLCYLESEEKLEKFMRFVCLTVDHLSIYTSLKSRTRCRRDVRQTSLLLLLFLFDHLILYKC